MFFASNLQKLRKKENMSQEALAEKLDVTRQSVSKWESGASYPEMDKLISICKIFNVDMDTLVNGDVLDEKKQDKETTINTKDILDKFNTLMKKIVCLFESMSFKEIIEFLVTVFLLIIIILIGTIPKDIIENLIGDGLLYDIAYVGPVLNTIFCLIIDILYSVFAIVVFIYVLKIKYLDRIKIKEDVNKEIVVKEKEKRVEEVEKVIIKDNTGSNSLTRLLAKIIIYIIKFFVVCFLIGPLICIVVLAVMLGFEVLFVFKGLPLIGILLFTIAGLIISALCFEVPLNFVINHKNNYKRVMITLLISLIIIIIGSIIFAFEFFSLTYVDSLPKNVKTKEITETLPMSNDLNTVGYYHNDIKYVVDDSLTDKIEVTVTYYDYLVDYNIEVELHNDSLLVYMNSPKEFSFKDALDEISDDIKDGKIYNYDKLNEYKVTIKTSNNNISIIKNNNEEFFNENNS